MLKVVPLYSSLRSVPLLARLIRSVLAAAISNRLFPSQPLIPGTIRPASNAMAMPMLIEPFICKWSPWKEALNLGCRPRAKALALIIRSLTLTRDSGGTVSLISRRKSTA